MGKAASKLSKDDISALKKSTYFDRRELQTWYKGFLRDCPSGQLSKEEFTKIYKQFFPFGEPNDFSNYVFNNFDTDHSGYIDFKEFIVAISTTSRGSLEEKLVWAFKMYDLNEDGKISFDEMLAIVKAIYKMSDPMVQLDDDESTPEKRVQKIFTLMDKDKDGEITLEEFKEGSKLDPSILHALKLYDGLV
ncbi:hypothetical protein BABINDRAFT_163769 [Babjeviella inositovora NRRL Y-12698]|uniref:Calcium-binding protein NCS-1 n=1 Tax=Babjeviella inositovora NRRL Y-12698 TaxID=984486 RepID=A0A1E3QJ75_9ASCO|nr:uncharacterized protein BABINDRAFT_163769 [Babjeviella inositovora NRRL Y-12698]ODQ77037.1 hypothetical protein BABINDRAFT_163769 [Babjeviella inositovora NRRL Y-12698]